MRVDFDLDGGDFAVLGFGDAHAVAPVDGAGRHEEEQVARQRPSCDMGDQFGRVLLCPAQRRGRREERLDLGNGGLIGCGDRHR
jgi:hypothetical protein